MKYALKLLFLLITLHFTCSFMVYSKEIPYQSEWLKKHYKDRMEMFAFQPLNQGDIVFVGDSITELGMSWAHRFDDLRVRNRGIKGDMTYGVLERLNEMINTPPKAIFIMIGVNDIFNYHYMREVKTLTSISHNIVKITEKLHKSLPQTKIYVQSILPDHRDFITLMVSSVNQDIQNIKNKKFTYIDLQSAFKTPEGVLNPMLTTDGTHLNKQGYHLWKKQLMPIITSLQ